MKSIFALVDCNNFFASCERIFRPDLKAKPIVILSNNDGCVIARSSEAKLLGIKMGEPYFKIRRFLEEKGVTVFSSNYSLYGDISNRVMMIIESMVPKIEVYSIDEAFIDFSGLDQRQSYELASLIKARVKREVGIDVCIGYSSTKTLAKLANYAAKKYPKTHGIVDLTSELRQKRLLQITPLSEVWGIGRRLAQELISEGFKTAWDLQQADSARMGRRYSVVVERTIKELSGVSCQEMVAEEPARQQIIFSRGFGQKVSSYDQMKEVVATYAERAAEKLREKQLFVKNIALFIHTNRFKNPGVYYNESSYHLQVPTNDSRLIVHGALESLATIWEANKEYVKAGIVLRNLSAGDFQKDLFRESQTEESLTLMRTIDQLNRRFGSVINLASQGKDHQWKMRREKLSPSYTTSWEELPRVK